MPQRIKRLKKFKALGVTRVIVPLLIIVGIASFGTYRLIASHAATLPDRLVAGQTLQSGAELTSPDTGMKFKMQTDGNLVLYNHDNKAVWQSNTYHKGYSVTLQTDGNFVMYDKTGKIAVWQSGTKGGTILIVQNDGNVVLSSTTAHVWNTATSGQEGTPLPVAKTVAPTPTPTTTTPTTTTTTTPTTKPTTTTTTTPTATTTTTPTTTKTTTTTTTPTTTKTTTPTTTKTTTSTITSLPGTKVTTPILIIKPIVLTNAYASSCPAPRPILQEGATGNCVKYLQQIFKNSGFGVNVNGTFDSTTYSAVVFYQANKKFTDNGVVTAQTWGALTGSTAVTTQVLGKGAASANQYASLCAAPRPILQFGATGNCVKYLQQIFKNSGFGVNVNGTFDSTTYSAVVFYQANKKYTANGVVGSQTWGALTDDLRVTTQTLGRGIPASASATANPYASLCPAPRPTLKESATGNCVKYLQQIFKGSGFNVAVDGSFGPPTLAAVVFYQHTAALPDNGIVGATTWNVLTGDNRVSSQTLGTGTWPVTNYSTGNYGGASNIVNAVGSAGSGTGSGGGSSSGGSSAGSSKTTCDSACWAAIARLYAGAGGVTTGEEVSGSANTNTGATTGEEISGYATTISASNLTGINPLAPPAKVILPLSPLLAVHGLR